MPAQGELRGPKVQEPKSVPAPRENKEATWQAPSAEELQESRARQWALATRHAVRAKAILVAGTCEVCHERLVRTCAIQNDILIVSPWQHGYAARHQAVLADPRRAGE